jgi:hypothetical protein
MGCAEAKPGIRALVEAMASSKRLAKVKKIMTQEFLRNNSRAD